MDGLTIRNQLLQYFPCLASPQVPLREADYRLVEFPAARQLFATGDDCNNYLLLTAGSVRVSLLTHSGKKVLLYRVKPGQSCVITTSCLLGNTRYPTMGETESPVQALILSRQKFKQALDHSSVFREFVFNGLSARLADVMARLEAINFTSIDARLAVALLRLQEGGVVSGATHEQLASEVGTAREVVSRHLKRLESDGLIQLKRGSITLIDTDRIARLCD